MRSSLTWLSECVGHVCSNGNRISTLFAREKSCHRVELYTGAESGWTRSSGIVFTDASRYECRYSDSRGLNPGARKTHLPHNNPRTISTQCWLVFEGFFFFLSFFPCFSSFNLSHTHTHTRIHTFLDGMDGSTCLVRISEQRSITFNRNKRGERMKRQKETGTTTNAPTTRFNIA
jgi:hypothetical protein